jgi:hypothetical protein
MFRARALALVTSALALGLSACTSGSSSPAPLGHGDDFFGLDATAAPQAPADDAGAQDGSPFAPVDSPYGVVPDGYAPLAACAQCACEAGTYCFGGAPGVVFSGLCDQTSSVGPAIGCHAIPAGCANEPDCVCILSGLAMQTSCYPACVEPTSGGFTVYCPP